LKHLNKGNRVIIPDSVEAELLDQQHSDVSLEQVLNAEWITVDRSDDVHFLGEFARYENRLARVL
jgi:hypothetical protein